MPQVRLSRFGGDPPGAPYVLGPLKPFQAEYSNNRDRTECPPAVLDEVSHDRTTSELLTSAHTDLRDAELDWETVAQANLEEQVRYLLGPLADPAFTEKADDHQRELVREWTLGDSSADASDWAGQDVRARRGASRPAARSEVVRGDLRLQLRADMPTARKHAVAEACTAVESGLKGQR